MKSRARISWSCLSFGLLILLVTQLLPAKEKEKQPESYALLSGTCFDGRGFRLAGVSVQVELTLETTVKLKKRRWEASSSPRGEFAIRLPAGQHTFRVAAAKDGFKSVEKTVSFEADERLDIALSLEVEPPKNRSAD